MYRSTLTDLGATTIPEEVREALGLRPNQSLTFELREDSVLVRPDRPSLLDLHGCLSQYAKTYASEEERDAAERAGIAEVIRENNPLPGDPHWPHS